MFLAFSFFLMFLSYLTFPKKIRKTFLHKNYCADYPVWNCINLYRPVCAWFRPYVKCRRYPCFFLARNDCFACSNIDVEYYTEGLC